MDSQLRKALGFALLFALVFGTVSAERAVAQTPLPAKDCPAGNTIMVNTDTFLTVEAADAAAKADNPSASERDLTMQELFDCAIERRGSTLQFADGTYDDVGITTIGTGGESGSKVTFRGNPGNREAVKFTGEVSFNVASNDILIEYITFEDTENIEMDNNCHRRRNCRDWPHVTDTIRIEFLFHPDRCRENVEIRNCVFRNTRSDGISIITTSGKSCAPRGYTVADSLFENIGYNNEWEDGYGPGDAGTGIPKIIDATVEGATTHENGTTPHQVIESQNVAIRFQALLGPIENVTITGNTINGTTHSGIVVHGVTGGAGKKIEISNNIVSNVPRSGIYVLERPTTTAKAYDLIIKNNLVVNSGTSPWLVSDYSWYADGFGSNGRYLPVKSILGDGTTAATDKVVDSFLKPEMWSYTENIVEDGTKIFGSEGAPVNIYDNFGGAGNPTDDRVSEYRGNGSRVSRSSSKIPRSSLSTFGNPRYDVNRASSCIGDDSNTMGVREDYFSCFSVVRFLEPYAAGAIQLSGVSTSGNVEIMENELRNNTLGILLCGGGECYFNSPYSVFHGYPDNNAAYSEPDISMNNIYGESRISEADRAKLPMEFARGAVYASIGDLTDKVGLDGNYLGQDPKLFTDPNSESLKEVGEYTGLATERLDIAIPLRLITATVTGDILTLTYSETLDSESVPDASDFTVMVGGEAGPAVATVIFSVSDTAVSLGLASAVEAGNIVTISYTPGSNPIRNASGVNVAALTDKAVTNNTPRPRPTRPRGPTGPGPVQPTPLELGTAAVAGDTLTLTYNKTLDSGSVPDPTDFTVMVGGEERNISMVSVNGATVTLTLASAVEAGDEVTVSYTPGDNPIRDASGENAAAQTDDRTTVSNNTSRPGPPGGGGGGSSGGGGCALASGGGGVGLGMLLALMVVPFGFTVASRRSFA